MKAVHLPRTGKISPSMKGDLGSASVPQLPPVIRASWDFPGGPVVKNPPSNAADTGSISGRGTKIPHAMGQLSPRATTTELVHLNERSRVPQTTEPMRPGARTTQLERENPCGHN